MFFLFALLVSVQAADGSRSTDYQIETAAPLVELQACIMRKYGPFGEATPIPMTDGTALDFNGPRNLLGLRKQAVMTVEIHEKTDRRLITFRYRHPMAEADIPKRFAPFQKACAPPVSSPS